MKLPWQRVQAQDGQEEIRVELPKETQEKLDAAIASGTAYGTKFDELKASLDSINARFTQEDEAKEAARRAAAVKANSESQPAREEEILNLMLSDPVTATRRLVREQTDVQGTALMTMRADALRRDVFEDAEKYPFYTGSIKAEIDKLLEGQTLQLRNDRGVIEHAYFSTLGRHQQEFLDGKLKSRYATAESNRGTSTGNIKETGSEQPRPLDEDGKKAARILGFKEDEYAKMLHEEGVGYA